MNKTSSIYLDLVRFSSAILVFAYHAKYARFDGAWLKGIGAYGHDAVMIFFVLSGFVIAYITSTQTSNLAAYTKGRLARLYSVVLPVLIITVVLDHFGKGLNPDMYIGSYYQASEPIYRFLANLFFINELWFSSWLPFSNGPFWSLCYEFWYYVIFASWFFFADYKRWLFTVAAMLIAGPKIVLLLPVWLMGVVAFHFCSTVKINRLTAICFAIAPVAAYFYTKENGVQQFLLARTIDLLGADFVNLDLKWSRKFLSDYFVGALVTVHLIGVISLSNSFSFHPSLEKTIRYFAGMTFAFYLLHYPLLQFFGSFINNGVFIVVLTSAAIILIAPLTEGKKREWGVFFDALFVQLAKLSKQITRNL